MKLKVPRGMEKEVRKTPKRKGKLEAWMRKNYILAPESKSEEEMEQIKEDARRQGEKIANGVAGVGIMMLAGFWIVVGIVVFMLCGGLMGGY